jgi:hypothetical protein
MSKTIEDLVTECCASIVSTDDTQESSIQKKYVLVVDVSGSTGDSFIDGNILSKEIKLATQFIVDHPRDQIMLYSFDSYVHKYGSISAMDDYVEFPDMHPGTATYTDKPLQSIIDNVSKFRPNEIIIYTDGQTNSPKRDILRVFTTLHDLNIKITIIAVTTSNVNLETISVREESILAGMDLVDIAKNLVDKLLIYNRYHHTIPFQGSSNSNVDKNSLRFLNVTLPKSNKPTIVIFIEFINSLIQKIDENNELLTWGNNNMSFKKMCTQIGLLLSVFHIDFPKNDYFVQEIAQRLSMVSQSSSIETPILTFDKIIDFFEYGYRSGRNNTPIIYTNLDEHVKDSVVKHNEFKDAEQSLRTYGTTMNSKSFISIPNNGVCFLVVKEE